MKWGPHFAITCGRFSKPHDAIQDWTSLDLTGKWVDRRQFCTIDAAATASQPNVWDGDGDDY